MSVRLTTMHCPAAGTRVPRKPVDKRVGPKPCTKCGGRCRIKMRGRPEKDCPKCEGTGRANPKYQAAVRIRKPCALCGDTGGIAALDAGPTAKPTSTARSWDGKLALAVDYNVRELSESAFDELEQLGVFGDCDEEEQLLDVRRLRLTVWSETYLRYCPGATVGDAEEHDEASDLIAASETHEAPIAVRYFQSVAHWLGAPISTAHAYAPDVANDVTAQAA